MHKRQHLVSLLPTVLLGKPTWGLGQKEQRNAQEDSGNHLQAPGKPERSVAVDIGTAIANEIHDQDAPCDGPLLKRDDTATLGWWRDLGDVDRYLSRTDTDTETVDNTTDDQHWNVNSGAAENRANYPKLVKVLAGGQKTSDSQDPVSFAFGLSYQIAQPI